jgi:hypothetical protein
VGHYLAPANSINQPSAVYTKMDEKAILPKHPVCKDIWKDMWIPLAEPGAKKRHMRHARSLDQESEQAPQQLQHDEP